MTKLPVLEPLLETGRAELRLHDKKPRMSEAEAKAEADRCLYCTDAPCIKACPTEIDIPTFIKKIATGNVTGSAKTIFEQNILGYACARVCPVEVLCQGSCVYTGWQHKPISIGRLQRYATELATDDLTKPVPTPKRGGIKKVACIGAGPASLAFAAYLALEGHQATIFEKRPLPGGLNTTGVAPYKLHAHDALREVEWVKTLGVAIETGAEIGKGVSGADLVAKYDAVFLGVGLGDDSKLGIPGEDGPGVVGATAWIEEMKLKRGAATHLGRVVVIGGGNTAVDVARECAQLGATDVVLAYRRTAAEMSGYAHELEGAKKDGVRIVTGVTPEIVRARQRRHARSGSVRSCRRRRYRSRVRSRRAGDRAVEAPRDRRRDAGGEGRRTRLRRRRGEDRQDRKPESVRGRRLRERRQRGGERRRRRARRRAPPPRDVERLTWPI